MSLSFRGTATAAGDSSSDDDGYVVVRLGPSAPLSNGNKSTDAVESSPTLHNDAGSLGPSEDSPVTADAPAAAPAPNGSAFTTPAADSAPTASAHVPEPASDGTPPLHTSPPPADAAPVTAVTAAPAPAPASDEGPQCRICLCPDSLSALIQPCLCIGSQQYVHRTCLDQWRTHPTAHGGASAHRRQQRREEQQQWQQRRGQPRARRQAAAAATPADAGSAAAAGAGGEAFRAFSIAGLPGVTLSYRGVFGGMMADPVELLFGDGDGDNDDDDDGGDGDDDGAGVGAGAGQQPAQEPGQPAVAAGPQRWGESGWQPDISSSSPAVSSVSSSSSSSASAPAQAQAQATTGSGSAAAPGPAAPAPFPPDTDHLPPSFFECSTCGFRYRLDTSGIPTPARFWSARVALDCLVPAAALAVLYAGIFSLCADVRGPPVPRVLLQTLAFTEPAYATSRAAPVSMDALSYPGLVAAQLTAAALGAASSLAWLVHKLAPRLCPWQPRTANLYFFLPGSPGGMAVSYLIAAGIGAVVGGAREFFRWRKRVRRDGGVQISDVQRYKVLDLRKK